MGCKSAAKSKLEEETVASSSSSSSSLFFSRCEEATQSLTERKTIREQRVKHGGKFSLGDEEDSDERNGVARVSSGRSFSLREGSGMSVIADDRVDR